MLERFAIAPMLAAPGVPADVRRGFVYEFKWDGARVIAITDGVRLLLTSRRGEDVTARYPELAGLPAALGRVAVLDGEVVALDGGRPSFAAVQHRLQLSDPGRIARAARERPVVLLIFDLLRLDGEDLTGLPYEERRARLSGLGLAGPRWQVPPSSDDLDDALAAAHALGLEGVVAKRLGSRYLPGRRSNDWRKLKLTGRQEFVVGGWRPGRGGRAGRFGSLLVGYHDEVGALRYAGAVGTGFKDAEIERLQRLLDERREPSSPFADPVPHRDAVFVRPELVVEVRFLEWTRDGLLRAPSYLGQREDKDPADVGRGT